MQSVQPHIRIGTHMTQARYAVLPGDPKRVGAVAHWLDRVEELTFNREYRSIRGWIDDVEVIVMSTGMGGASTGIAVEELNRLGITTLIRIGSCGALQSGIQLGDIVIAAGAVRDDGASAAYIDKGYPAIPDPELLCALMHTADELKLPWHCGRIRSHDSFYTDREEEIDRYWSGKGILAADMETSALFVIGGLRGMRTASILNVVVEHEGDLEQGINNLVAQEDACALGEEREIRLALEAIRADAQRLAR
ncbi:nucleoside phosphorylase [Paenibacillus profundus]|uniref:Uridine phosphorylase n=2 Tax=Paenibacillus TaxID=44249 RepID=A0ABS8YPB9_9BACL|nr:nucleoside phosphorylase [Paenibacillus profundus]MCE5172176.1 nucleoside phosphorylase [Paenibacillus profundus]